MKEIQYFSDILGKLVELIPFPFEVEVAIAERDVDYFVDVVTEVLNNSVYKNSYSYKIEVSGKNGELHSVCRVAIGSVTDNV